MNGYVISYQCIDDASDGAYDCNVCECFDIVNSLVDAKRICQTETNNDIDIANSIGDDYPKQPYERLKWERETKKTIRSIHGGDLGPLVWFITRLKIDS